MLTQAKKLCRLSPGVILQVFCSTLVLRISHTHLNEADVFALLHFPCSHRWSTGSWQQFGSILASAVYHRKVLMRSPADRVTTGRRLRSPDSGNDDEGLLGALTVGPGVCVCSVLVCADTSSEISAAAIRRLEAHRGNKVDVYLLSGVSCTHKPLNNCSLTTCDGLKGFELTGSD